MLVAAASLGLLRSAHDAAEGGLAIALAECAVRSGIGLDAVLPQALADLTPQVQADAVAQPLRVRRLRRGLRCGLGRHPPEPRRDEARGEYENGRCAFHDGFLPNGLEPS